MLIGVCPLYVDSKGISDHFTDFPNQSSSHPIDLTPFPALASLKICVHGGIPSPHLINALSSIFSVPVSTSVALECWWNFPMVPDPSNSWDRLDRWLSQMARSTTVEGGLVLTLAFWQSRGVPEGFLPRFRETGKINTDSFQFGRDEEGRSCSVEGDLGTWPKDRLLQGTS